MKTLLCLLAFNVISVTKAEDICSLPSETGPCKAAFKKWYYNSADMECQQFVYGGCLGNANNFETEQECQNECADVCSRPAFTGPCKARKPRWYYNSADKECQEFIYGGCQSNGNNFITKAECQNECADVCSRPAFTGPCKARKPRWYYNSADKECQEFIYGGCQSNGNNFITKAECQNECADVCSRPAFTGPCKARKPRWYYNSADKECQEFIYGGCQSNGNNFITKAECQNECADVCSRPAFTGPCKARKPRWYYNSADKECQEFIYGGCQSNGNNFMTKAECQDECAAVCSRPAFTGPCRAFFRKWYYNSANKKCEIFTYGGCQSNGNNFDTEDECERQCSDDIDECSLPIESGPCEAYIPRWAFNTTSQKCERFFYGGCDGNANNFETEKECFNACDKTGCDYVNCTATHCPAGIKMVKGCNNKKCQCRCPCRKKKCTNPDHECVLRENYKCKGKSCPLIAECDYKLCTIGELFSYSGCGYDKQECPSGFTCKWSPVDAPHGCCPNDICHAKPNSGCGKKQKMRWYYDFEKQECFKFRFGGQGGNENNFKTEAACLKKCA